MSLMLWFITLAAIHLCLVGTALFVVIRSNAYSRKQIVIQLFLALFVPLLGVALIVIVAKNAIAPFPKPENSRFDPDNFGSGAG